MNVNRCYLLINYDREEGLKSRLIELIKAIWYLTYSSVQREDC